MRYDSVQNAEIYLFCSENRNFFVKNTDTINHSSLLVAMATDLKKRNPPFQASLEVDFLFLQSHHRRQ